MQGSLYLRKIYDMWMILGIGAVITGLFNLIAWCTKSKQLNLFRFISLSLTALTVCAIYSEDAQWVITNDWSALIDVVPTMSKAIWILVILSILINGATLLKRK